MAVGQGSSRRAVEVGVYLLGPDDSIELMGEAGARGEEALGMRRWWLLPWGQIIAWAMPVGALVPHDCYLLPMYVLFQPWFVRLKAW